MDIVEVARDEPQPELVEGLVALQNATSAADAPWLNPYTPTSFSGIVRFGWDLEPARHFAGLVDGRVVAHGTVETTEWDNHDLAWLGVTVPPDLRGQGLGSQMTEHVLATAAAMGRTKLGADAWEGSPGVAFAESRGFQARSRAINRRQHLDEVPLDKVQAVYDDAAASATDYELVRLVGRTPAGLLPGLARVAASINDAPLDDLEIEDENFAPERVANYETACERRGQRLYRLLARHRDSGELAGHTAVGVDVERPHIAYQHDTAVAREHRGHRLGLVLKTAMNLWLAEAEPELRTIDTWNAESNDHMIAVNEELGYRWMGRELQFQK